MNFSRDEEFLMMLYSPGSRQGLIDTLCKMSAVLNLSDPDDYALSVLTNTVLDKLRNLSDEDFSQLDLYQNL